MSTQFYIKDENGFYLSTDGKTRYSLLKGKAAKEFLKTEEGKRRHYFVAVDENGDKLGIEASFDFKDKYKSDLRHTKYLREIETECEYTIISANTSVSNYTEDEIELIDTIAVDEYTEEHAIHNLDLETLRKSLKNLNTDEYELIYSLYLANQPLTERQLSANTGIPQKTINNRKKRILKKLKNFF